MEIDLSDISGLYRKAHEMRHSSHEVRDRLTPSIFRYDYLSLRRRVTDVNRHVAEVLPRSVKIQGLPSILAAGRALTVS